MKISGKEKGNVYSNPQEATSIQFPRMQEKRRMRITAEEEERAKAGYKIINSYTKSANAKTKKLVKENKSLAKLTFERTAQFRHVNLGSQLDFNRGDIGFNLDIINREWVSKDNNGLQRYLTDRKVNANDVHRQINLMVESRNDVIVLEATDSVKSDTEGFGLTLVNTLVQAICNVLNLDESEIHGYYQPIHNQNGRVVIFETSEGGTGTLSSIVASEDLIRKIALKALNILHFDNDGNDLEGACAHSCYNCICNFYNQRIHKQLDRHLVRDFLLDLSTFKGFEKAKDNAVLYEAYIKDDKTTSLEKEVLKRLNENGVDMPEEIHKVITHKGETIAEADLFYEPRFCVFIDGPDHDMEHIKRDDATKRKKVLIINS